MRIALSVACLVYIGCSHGTRDDISAVSAAPLVAIPPVSQFATVGAATTFSVEATGTGPLSYQWNWNGSAINGATDSFYVTPIAVPADNQSVFTVTVTNQIGAVTSAQAVLSVEGSPRAPIPGDLRFKDVDAFPFGISWTTDTAILGDLSETYGNQVGTPLQIGWPGPPTSDGNPANTTWFFNVGSLPAGSLARSTAYRAGVLANFSADLIAPGSSTIPPIDDVNSIISSIDFSSDQNAYAVELVRVPMGGDYTLTTQTIDPTTLQTVATQEGGVGHVITSISLNAGSATYFSYGWSGDPYTVYEASVSTATVDTIYTVATNLAQQGFIITAFGGNDIDGFFLVGTRVKGDSTPRQIWIGSNMPSRGYTVVMSVLVDNPANGAFVSQEYICEM